MVYKTCTKCKEIKPATPKYFYRDSSTKDKLNRQCKDCVNKYLKEWNKKMKEKALLKVFGKKGEMNND